MSKPTPNTEKPEAEKAISAKKGERSAFLLPMSVVASAVLLFSAGCTESEDESAVATVSESIVSEDQSVGDQGVSGVDLNSSKLPEAYAFSEDGRQLLRGKSAVDGFYGLDTVASLYLTFDAAYPEWFEAVDAATDAEERVSATLEFEGEIFEQVGVRFRGNTSEMNAAERKSFDIELDTVIDGADIDGYNKLNLNNAFEDPSYVREVFYANQSRRHMSEAAANFVNLYVNGSFWGIYSNVQELNKDFLAQWYLSNDNTNMRAGSAQMGGGGEGGAGGMPGGGVPPGGVPGDGADPLLPPEREFPPVFGDGTEPPAGAEGGMPGFADGSHALDYLGDEPSTYEAFYELKSTQSSDPYAELIPAIRALDGVTAETVAELVEVLDVDQSLWFIAHEILYGDDDGYISKGAMDYHLSYDIATERLIPYESDGNSVMMAAHAYDVFYREDNALFPLANKLFAIPEMRQRYLAHVRTLLRENFDPLVADTSLDTYRTMVDAGVAADPHPHEGYSYAGLNDAVEEIKTFVADRYALLISDEDVSKTAPQITDAAFYVGDALDATPSAADSPLVSVSLSHAQGIRAAWLYYGTGVVGSFDKVALLDDGAGIDLLAADGVYSASLPAHAAGTYVRYYIEAIAADGADDFGTLSYLPVGAEHDVFVYQVPVVAELESAIVINELLASNASNNVDDNGEFDDWVELFNNSDSAVSLSGLYLSDSQTAADRWALPEVIVEAGGYIGLWLDKDEEQGILHGDFSLSAGGESLTLFNAQGQVLDTVTFAEQSGDISYGRVPDGSGAFATMTPSFERSNSQL